MKYLVPFLAFVFLFASCASASEVVGSLAGIVIGAPVAGITSGSYVGPQKVDLFATGSTGIVYTLNATTPDCASSARYTTALSLAENTRLEAVACFAQHDGTQLASDVVRYDYAITAGASSGSGGASGSMGFVSAVKGTPVPLAPGVGEVLSSATVNTACMPFLSGPLVFGGDSNLPADVRKLQRFLNDNLGTRVPVTGFFGPLTRVAVKTFQVGHKASIFLPGYSGSGTGNVYLKTMHAIEAIACAGK